MESTSRKIQATLSSIPDEPRRDYTCPYFPDTDKRKIHAVIGLMYFRGLLGQNYHHVNRIFSERSGHPVFGNKRNFFNYIRIRLLVNTTFWAILCGPSSDVQTVREEEILKNTPKRNSHTLTIVRQKNQ